MRLYPFFIPHAGCPHRCSFCQQQETSGQQEVFPPERVAAELSAMLAVGAGGQVAFYGGTFSALPGSLQDKYLEAVSPFLCSGQVSGVRISTRPDALADRQIDRLKQRGVATVEVGVQSFCDSVLENVNRGHGSAIVAPAVSRLRSAGLEVGIQLMPGLPGGSRREALASLRRALELKPDFLRIYPAVVLRGTPLADRYRAGEYRPFSLEEAVDCCAEMSWICRQAEVPIIRLGLQATPALDADGGVLAGPYHPAFGQLVRSRIWRRALDRAATTGADVAHVHPADAADAIGHRRDNMLYLNKKHAHFELKPSPGTQRGTLVFGGTSHVALDLAAFAQESLN